MHTDNNFKNDEHLKYLYTYIICIGKLTPTPIFDGLLDLQCKSHESSQRGAGMACDYC